MNWTAFRRIVDALDELELHGEISWENRRNIIQYLRTLCAMNLTFSKGRACIRPIDYM